jgi:adenosylhomocysteine nucleosidase
LIRGAVLTPRFPRIGIVAGLDRELAGFCPDRPRERVVGAPFPVHRLDLDGRQVFLASTGIGKVAAATAATFLAAACRVDLLLVIGTAGALEPIEGRVFLIADAVQADYGARRADGLVPYTAGTWPIGDATLETFRPMDTPGLDLPTARIASGDVFVECDDHAAWLRRTFGATLVDMEVAAVAQAAALLGLPWAAIKATTDGADEGSAGDFMAHLGAAADAAGAAAMRLIAGL